jgi:hypothetical protein
MESTSASQLQSQTNASSHLPLTLWFLQSSHHHFTCWMTKPITATAASSPAWEFKEMCRMSMISTNYQLLMPASLLL